MAEKKYKIDIPPMLKEHWEKKYDPCVYENSKTVMGSEFNPKRSKDRMTTYEKVNETDH